MSKRMKYLFTILIAGICLVSCNSNEDSENNENINNDPLVEHMKIEADYQSATSNPWDVNFGFEYDAKKRLTKRNGGYIPMPASSGYGRVFTDEIHTSLIYTDNKVAVEDFIVSDYWTMTRWPIYYTLNSSNQIEEKEKPAPFYFRPSKEFYKYSKGKLIEIITTYPGMEYDPNEPLDFILTYSEKFYYDANDNLVKTERFEQQNGKIKGRKIIRTFEDYDTSYNPFKRFQLLQQYFYRSLSRNNFRKYKEIEYNESNENVGGVQSIFEFIYDAQGNIVLDK